MYTESDTNSVFDRSVEGGYDSQLLGDSVPPKNQGSDVKSWLPIVISTIILSGSVIWAAHYEISKIDDRMSGIDKRMAKLETAIRILSDSQGGNTKELVHEALTVATAKVRSGETTSAKNVLVTANKIIAENRELKNPASNEFFERAINSYRILRLNPDRSVSSEALRGKLLLAEYRSALTQIPSDFRPKNEYSSSTYIGHMVIHNGFVIVNDSQFNGPQDFHLDNSELSNVIFNGTTIFYDGGPVRLKNVKFVNCTFKVPDSRRVDEVLEAAALGELTVNIG